MTGFKNLLYKWVLLCFWTTELTLGLKLGEISTNLTYFPHPKVNFYSIQSANDISGNISVIYDFRSWNDTKNYTEDIWNFNTSIAEDPENCPKEQKIPCEPGNKYRAINGSCNNLEHPAWGTAFECYQRYQPAFYEGFDKLRKSLNGDPLPSARDITANIFTDVHRPSNTSFMFAVYGQTVAHDLSRADILDIPINCCSPEFFNHSSCQSIPINPSDPVYSKINKTCQSMHRTRSCTDSCTNTTQREQTNGATVALDVSIVYGVDDSSIMDIRAKDGTGKLILNLTEYGELLPIDLDPPYILCPQKNRIPCFASGDRRTSQHAILSGITTFYAREHNRLASKLKLINPHWEEEQLFQEARRINIATLQCITYKEYLPQLLGSYIMDRFRLTIGNSTDGSKYNPKIRLGVSNEFATAAFRLHSMIPKTVETMDFKSLYFNTTIIRAGHLERIMQGVCKVPSQKYDNHFVEDVTSYFGWRTGITFGIDLVAIDIQRGRDHGLPPYTVMVRFCSEGLINISTFDDLVPLLMTDEKAELLKENYASVEDIDFWVGLQMENHFPGSEVGPTAVCIIAEQFHTAKFGDRFFFEHEGEVPSFTTAQRNSLKRCSLSRLLCDNSNITRVQKNVMLLPSKDNPELPCEEIPEIDLSHWTDSPA